MANRKPSIKEECLSALGAEDIQQLSSDQLESALDWSVDRVAMQDDIAKDAEKDKKEARQFLSDLITEVGKRANVENPEKTKFKWGGYQRILVERGASFNYEEFAREHPDIYKHVIEEKISRILREDAVVALVEERPELLPIFQRYAIPGTISTQIRTAAEESDD